MMKEGGSGLGFLPLVMPLQQVLPPGNQDLFRCNVLD